MQFALLPPTPMNDVPLSIRAKRPPILSPRSVSTELISAFELAMGHVSNIIAY